jgi:hypothetical protein
MFAQNPKLHLKAHVSLNTNQQSLSLEHALDGIGGLLPPPPFSA